MGNPPQGDVDSNALHFPADIHEAENGGVNGGQNGGVVPIPFIDAKTFQKCTESPTESQRLWALQSVGEVLFQGNAELVRKVLMLLCDPCWAVKRQALLLLQRLGACLDNDCINVLQRLLYHPDNTVQLFVARILEHVPKADDSWKQKVQSKSVAHAAVMQFGLALEFLMDDFKEDREIVLAAVTQNGEALEFAPKWCQDEEIVLAAVMQCGAAVRFADATLVAENPGLQALQEGRGLGLCGSYLVLEEIGKGVYGSVCRAEHLQSQHVVAIKKLHFEADFWADGIPAHTLREVSLLKRFQHKNIVRLLDVLDVGPTDIRLVFEFLPCDLFQTLKSLKKEGQMMPLERLRRYSADLMEGLLACHTRSLIHRDLKPQNILLTHEGSLKIADFGLARMMATPNRSYTLEVVTLWYRAPEMLLGTQRYGYEVDCWSAGCVIAEMATTRPLFPGDSEVDTLFKIFRLFGTPSENNWPDGTGLRHWKERFPKWDGSGLQPLLDKRPELNQENGGADLLRQLLCMNPNDRMTSRRAKQHPFCLSTPEAP